MAALLVFTVAAAWDWRLPGLYMDAVNPEYIIPGILNPDGAGNRPWILPGNVLLDRFPVFTGTLYHGSTQLYFALPVLAAFGVDVASLRLAQTLAGGLILLLAARLLRGHASGARAALAATALLLLALDPSFVIALRTQAYSCIFPMMLLLGAVLLLRDGRERAQPMPRFAAAGLLFGLAVFSYFIFAFFFPALLWLVLRKGGAHGAASRWRGLLVWLIGCAVGCLPTLCGLLLIKDELGSVAALLDWLHLRSSDLKVMGDDTSVAARIASVANDFWHVVDSDWPRRMILRRYDGGPVAAVKAALLIGLPAVALWRSRGTPERFDVLLPLALATSFLVCACIFGGRLGGHHYTALMPLLYVAFGSACALLWTQPTTPPAVSRRYIGGVAVLATAMGIANAHALARMHGDLRTTGGVGLYSDAIDRFSAEVSTHDPGATVYLPDWGFVMPFMFLTKASVAQRDAVHPFRVRREACAGKPQIVVFTGTDNAAKIALIANIADLPAPAVRTWTQRDGTPVFQSARFDPRDGCQDEPSPSSLPTATPRIALQPAALHTCAFLGPARVSAQWDAAGMASRVKVFVQPAGAPATLWTDGDARGSASTGPWATPGMKFILRDEANDSVLAEAVVEPKACPTP